ncbi:MAG TPA: ferrochelatase [Sphingomicrobium sp.]|nr:ferrochelatase [Sphingomicrobium sp.]
MIGVLLINLGTPDAPDARSVRRYLAEFLSDRRVVEIPSIAWQPILRGIILRTRPRKSAEAYRQVWTDEGSPLQYLTRKQADELAERLGGPVLVRYAMRYGKPAIGATISAMMADGATRILVAPLYPQYSAATTGTAVDAVGAALARMRSQPALRFLPPYYDDPAYIGALAGDVTRHLTELDWKADAIVASFHGLPERAVRLGDPYQRHCQETARLLSERLGRDLVVSFQSRFGRAKWLEPATDATLARLAREGARRVAVLAPGFAVDCLETLEELAIRGKALFEAAGGERFAYLPCLNADEPGMAMLETLARRELAGWLPAT